MLLTDMPQRPGRSPASLHDLRSCEGASPSGGPRPALPSPPGADTRLREAATELEATFLKEMLQAAGLGRVPGIGGGSGEEQFASFLLDAQARRIAESGGIGLAGSIMAAMARDAGQDTEERAGG